MSNAFEFRSSTAFSKDELRSLSNPTLSNQESNGSSASRCPSNNNNNNNNNNKHDGTYREYKDKDASSSIHHGQLALPPSNSSSPRPPTYPFARFQSTTTAPSPPLQSMSFHDARIPEETDTEAGATQHGSHITTLSGATQPPSLFRRSSANVNENTNLSPSRPPQPTIPLSHQLSTNSLRLLTRTPSLKAALTGSRGSVRSMGGTSSGYTSPVIAAMDDVTPLPSPLLPGDSPGPWKKLATNSATPPDRRDKPRGTAKDSTRATGANESGKKRHLYTSLNENNEVAGLAPPTASQQQAPWHTRNRSISDYTPESTVKSARQLAVPDPQIKTGSGESQIRRERILAESRGITSSVAQPPTPPPSESSKDLVEEATAPRGEYFEAHDRYDKKLRRWRSVRTVGQGTFSRVVLATSQMDLPEDGSKSTSCSTSTFPDPRLDRKTLVAVKICEHGPLGGASEERVEMSLKRELEIMQSIHHPSLADLKAWRIEPTRAILVLSYCPGGDLFEIATIHRQVLTPQLMRRVFAELVGAVSYLHKQMIVHRDIKLENVLVNLTPDELADPSIDWATYPYSVTALADLGLSRRIAADEKLETRCGSEDYAAPEVIMGQTYNGLATDAWSLGVLLYALLESRLPFDPHPGMNDSHRMRSRKSHRIARVEWRWCEYEGEDGDNDGNEAKFEERGLLGAMRITEGLLKRARSRWTLDRVGAEPWVGEAITVKGGLRFREEIGGAEVLGQ